MGFRRAAVVMAGGSGTRFWPVSTESRPKQFLRLASPEATLLEQSLERAEAVAAGSVFIATSGALVEETRRALPSFASSHVFGEPARRNTLGAMVWAMAHVKRALGENASVAVLTADHLISPVTGFVKSVEQAMSLAEQGASLVTIGIPTTRAATEYGYIEKGVALGDRAWKAQRFTEKPDSQTASEFVSSGRFLWNSGMFFWTLAAFESALSVANPSAFETYQSVCSALMRDDLVSAESAFAQLPSISIDYALMERAPDVAVVAAGFEWDDLGSWDALSRALEKDENGNVSLGSARLISSSDSVVYNESSQRVNVLGMEGVVVVVTDREVMVCPKERAQDVRELAVDD